MDIISSQKEIEIQNLHDASDEYLNKIMLFENKFVSENENLLVLQKEAYLEKRQRFIQKASTFVTKISTQNRIPYTEMEKDTQILSDRARDIIMCLKRANGRMLIQENKILTRFEKRGNKEKIGKIWKLLITPSDI